MKENMVVILHNQEKTDTKIVLKRPNAIVPLDAEFICKATRKRTPEFCQNGVSDFQDTAKQVRGSIPGDQR